MFATPLDKTPPLVLVVGLAAADAEEEAAAALPDPAVCHLRDRALKTALTSIC
jgi:hypothetical protein